jgi:surface polysaccharide O-acyltransferase-like enzyme
MVFLILFNKIKSNNINILNVLADSSFGIFFIHIVLINIVGIVTSLFGINYKTESFLIYLLVVSFILFISLLLVLLGKRILGSKSRYFIGV